jgi:hypothetical protein
MSSTCRHIPMPNGRNNNWDERLTHLEILEDPSVRIPMAASLALDIANATESLPNERQVELRWARHHVLHAGCAESDWDLRHHVSKARDYIADAILRFLLADGES